MLIGDKHMINYRTGTFETNSSSMHSIIISPEGTNPRNYSLADTNEISVSHDFIDNEYVETEYRFRNGDYVRWPFQILRKPADKLLYAIASEEITIPEAFQLVRKHNPHFQYFYFHVEKYKKHKVVEESYRYDGENWYKRKDIYHAQEKKCKGLDSYGSVDHQSMGLLTTFLSSRGITLEDFVFGEQYTIIIDGDEYDFIGMLESLGYEAKEGMEVYYG